jgi:hypothetical protein
MTHLPDHCQLSPVARCYRLDHTLAPMRFTSQSGLRTRCRINIASIALFPRSGTPLSLGHEHITSQPQQRRDDPQHQLAQLQLRERVCALPKTLRLETP